MGNPFPLLVPLTPTHTSLLLSPCLSTLSPELQPQGCRHLLDKDTFVLLVEFLLGPSPKNQSETSDPTQHEKAPPRRWSSNQVKEFGPLHCTLSLLVRNTDISIFESESDSNEEAGLNPYTIPAKLVEVVPPSDGMHQALFTIDCSKRFIREVGVASFTSLVFHTYSLPSSLPKFSPPTPSFPLPCPLSVPSSLSPLFSFPSLLPCPLPPSPTSTVYTDSEGE